MGPAGFRNLSRVTARVKLAERRRTGWKTTSRSETNSTRPFRPSYKWSSSGWAPSEVGLEVSVMTTGKVACYRCGNTSRVKVEIRLSDGVWVPVCPSCVRPMERPRQIKR